VDSRKHQKFEKIGESSCEWAKKVVMNGQKLVSGLFKDKKLDSQNFAKSPTAIFKIVGNTLHMRNI
jgi:hypothetical protein